jgi:hypothetical protein
MWTFPRHVFERAEPLFWASYYSRSEEFPNPFNPVKQKHG